MSGDLVITNAVLSLASGPLFPALSLTVSPGQVVTVKGPSGCGKSSLLAWIAGVLDPAFSSRGSLTLDGHDLLGLPAWRRRVGLMFQDPLLLPHRSLAGNLAFALPPGLSKPERHRRIAEALAEAGLAGLADADPATLSGGQASRAALMRTVLAAPKALLLDEPFARLDVPLRDHLRAFVFEHARRRRLPTLLVTHDPQDAAAAAGPVIDLASGADKDCAGSD